MANEYDMSDIEARRLEEKRAAYNSRYLIGTPVFSELRKGNYFYIDKTEMVGYLSITDYDEDDDVYLIDKPNKEVRSASKFLATQI